MYKILLSDDEQIVLDSLQQIIKQKYGDNCIVSMARSGREAIILAQTSYPDLVVMDINMPGINGIEAIKTIREISPGTLFILLTALDKFDYARQAVNLGVLEYLTKPFNRKRIIEAFESALAHIEANRLRRTNELEMREKLENVRSILETGFFYSFLFADNQQSETLRYLNLLDIPSPDGLIMTLEFGERRDNNLPQNRIGSNIRVNRDYLTLRAFIKIVTPCLVGPLILNRISIFIPIEGCLIGRLDKQIEEMACQIFKRVQQKIETELRIGVSRPIESVGQLHGAYQETILALQITPAGEIRYYKDLQPNLMTTENDHLELLVNQYLHAVSQGDTELTSQLFSQLLLSLETCGLQNLSQAKSKVMEWLFLAVRQTRKPNANTFVSLDYTALLSSDTPSELRQRALEKILELTVQLSGIHGRPANDLIAQARNYIDENYAKNISLESVAELIALSPPYFSRLFRSQVGKTFIDYLTDLRMSRACQLLREGSLSIKEVTSAVGYTDPNYFSRIFKRVIGQTPSEFRS